MLIYLTGEQKPILMWWRYFPIKRDSYSPLIQMKQDVII